MLILYSNAKKRDTNFTNYSALIHEICVKFNLIICGYIVDYHFGSFYFLKKEQSKS
jgi:hypothetical protein